ncbi:hypothetical protein [Erythrobacter sp. CCH5-A1]|jgi:hypothetical protein|uniref:hypothetical protein n=1 Tax=Erythrobacter sp. CCH5-A1 TaxID=1768792 RepID=UPI00083619B5|nr:hypothetical protein [Erythrobacter sp. CCH5-A1]
MMQKIERGQGITRSERKLAKLADKTFLSLWAYPNSYNDRDMRKGQGKELCDLLAVCGDDVLVFSDKEITWPNGDLETAWRRWYRRAVTSSVKQIRGAERWIRTHPDRVFIDAECKTQLPVNLPPPARLRIHGIVVTSGSEPAVRQHVGDKDGTLMVIGQPPSPQSGSSASIDFPPFMVGDPDPQGSFVHVFDAPSLKLVMSELDTISDFVAYLIERSNAIRSGTLGIAAAEADLLALYLSNAGPDGRNQLPVGPAYNNDMLAVAPGNYRALRASPEYRARVAANAGSYHWDRLIELFARNLLGGTSVAVAGMQPEIRSAEVALRQMALECRVNRRALGHAFMSAYRKAEEAKQDRFARLILPFEGCADPESAYLFLVLAYRGDWLTAKGYDYYREGRGGFLKAYCQVALFQNRSLKRIVGIAVDAAPSLTGRVGGSEDLMMVQIDEWTPELEEETRKWQDEAEILLRDRLQPSLLRQRSLAERDIDRFYSGNRKERLAARAKARRGAKKGPR